MNEYRMRISSEFELPKQIQKLAGLAITENSYDKYKRTITYQQMRQKTIKIYPVSICNVNDNAHVEV